MSKILLIDGNSVAYRAFYALPELRSPNGTPTGAIFGFLKMFLKSIEEFKPSGVLVVFDHSKTTFRNEIYKEYKATRKPTPEPLKEQFKLLKELLKTMGVATIEKQGLEADDIIGCVSKLSKESVLIISGDKDVLQLLGDGVEVALTKKGLSEFTLYNEDLFTKTYGFKPTSLVDLKAIMGDTSDNIPGVKGIGEKGASGLIQEFGTIERLYEELDAATNITARNKELLLASKNDAILSKRLATIECKAELDLALDSLNFTLPFSDEAKKEFIDLGFRSLLNNSKLFDISNIQEEVVAKKTAEEIIITTENELKRFVDTILNSEIALGFLITPTDVQIAVSVDKVYKIKTKESLFDEGMNFIGVLKILKPIFEDKSQKLIVHNYKELIYRLREFEIKLKTDFDDVMLTAWLVNSGKTYIKIDTLFADYNETKSADALIRIFKSNIETLTKTGAIDVYNKIEKPSVKVLQNMEDAGVNVSKDSLVELLEKFRDEETDLKAKIYLAADKEFNINSPKQVSDILYNHLAIKPINKDLDTAIDTLQKLESAHPIVGLIIEYRKVAKLISTYVEAYLGIIEKNKENFIHTTFNQTGTATGRLSSSEPNFQNIPIKTEKGREIRKMFVSRFDDGQIVSADYNQIELRLMAHLSQDEKMIAAYNAGADIHRTTASQVFGEKPEDVTSEQRRNAKAVNFGIIYGISAFGLSEQLKIPAYVAKNYIDTYFENFKNVKLFMEATVENARKNNGTVKTEFGRVRVINELFSQNHNLRNFGERAAINMPIQGTASDIIKLAMLRVYERLKTEKLKTILMLQIHDELVFDSPKNEVEVVKKLIKEEMEKVIKLSVPLVVDVNNGKSLYDC
ncbi:MAG: DNA polymerase I [Firmicutes bacterium]|nr:DNA polymerase I [Bacillota bacterium]